MLLSILYHSFNQIVFNYFFFFICDVEDSVAVESIVKPLLDRTILILGECNIRLSQDFDPILQNIAHRTAKQAMGYILEEESSLFSFLALPAELRHKILDHFWGLKCSWMHSHQWCYHTCNSLRLCFHQQITNTLRVWGPAFKAWMHTIDYVQDNLNLPNLTLRIYFSDFQELDCATPFRKRLKHPEGFKSVGGASMQIICCLGRLNGLNWFFVHAA